MHLSKFCYQTETNSDEEEEVNRLPVIKPANKYVEKINKYLTILKKCDENLQVIKDNVKHFDVKFAVRYDDGSVNIKSYAVHRILSNYTAFFGDQYYAFNSDNKDYEKELIYYFESIDDDDYNKRKFTSKDKIFKEFERVFSDFEKRDFIDITKTETIKIDEVCNKIKMKDSNYYNEKESTDDKHHVEHILNRIKNIRKNYKNLIMNFRLLSDYFNNNYNKYQMFIHRKLNLQKEISKNYSKSINMIDDLINQFKSIINKLEYISEENLNFIQTFIYENSDLSDCCYSVSHFEYNSRYNWSEQKVKVKEVIKSFTQRLKKINGKNNFESFCNNEKSKQSCLKQINVKIKVFIETLYFIKQTLKIFYLELDEKKWNRDRDSRLQEN